MELGNVIVSISTSAEIKERTFNTRTYKAAAHDGIMQIPSTSLEVNPLAKKYTGTDKIKKQQIRQPEATYDLDILIGSHQTMSWECRNQYHERID